ncbi:hypothetical protein CLOSTMETH_01066 [[Clostridium] methylpentosum DSM 5476]|uniref:Uncharacterized protein n=1 Tax=[Clostridium] methylpentosum DSM 5476 TaxID=537013 RepID=C0EB49_9FIRM|nr:hypothetical protein CLOSTMETH_01066 [[Clostridium] methylpentosum DSM 5476]
MFCRLAHILQIGKIDCKGSWLETSLPFPPSSPPGSLMHSAIC